MHDQTRLVETAEQRAVRLKLVNVASSKKGDLQKHDANIRRLLDVARQRLDFAGEVHREYGPVSLELRLAVLDLDTSMALLKETVL